MAKDIDDDFDLDDLDDLDFGDEPPIGASSSDRNPVLETIRTARKSAMDAVIPRQQRADLILDGLPRPATDLYANVKDLEYVASDVYSHTKEELRKTQKTLKYQTRQLIPTMRKYLPDAIVDPVNRWAKPEDFEYQQKYDPQQAMIDRGLAEVFGQQGGQTTDSALENKEAEKEEQTQRIEENVENKLRETVRDIKQDNLLETVVGISREISAMSSFTRGMNVNFQRKLLEINYRQLFAMQDIAALTKSTFDRNAPALEAIVKNTALPDYAKENFGEVRSAEMKRKVAEWISPARYMDGFVQNFQERLKSKITNTLQGGGGILGSILEMGVEDDDGDMFSDTMQSPDSRSDNLKQKGVGLFAGSLAKKFINPQRDRLLKWARKELEDKPEFLEFLNKGKYLTGNLSSISASSLAGERDGGLADFFRTSADFGLVDRYRRESINLGERDAEFLGTASKFDNRTYLTLNEVIPAELREIRLAVLKTIGETDDRVYDLTARGYVDQDTIGNRVRKHVGADDLRKRQRQRIDNIIDKISKDAFTAPERAKIGKFIEDRISTGKEFNIAAILDDPSIVTRYMGYETGSKFVDVLNGITDGGDTAYTKTNEIGDEINSLRRSVSSYQQRVESARDIYGDAGLMASKLFKYDEKTDRIISDANLTDIYRDVGTVDNADYTTQREKDIHARIKSHLGRKSATADYLARFKAMQTEDDAEATSSIADTLEKRKRKNTSSRPVKGNPFNFKQLREVLYGSKSTNFTELFKGNVLGKESKENPVYTDDFTRVVESIKGIGVKDEVSKILEHIRSMDEDGVLLATLDTGKKGKTRGTGEGKKTKGKKAKRKQIDLGYEKGLISRWFGVVGDTASVGWSGAKKVLGGVRDFGKGIGERFNTGEGGFVRNTLSKTRDFAKDGFVAGIRGGVAFGKSLVGARDIYDSSGEIVLNGHKLKNGQYYIKVGDELKAIFTIDEIGTGPIYDKDGNTVLTEEKLAKAGELSFYKDKRWWKITEVLGGGVGNILNKLAKRPGQGLSLVKDKLTDARKWLTTYPDMYVPGEKTPRIKGRVLKEGGYRLRESGKVVYKPEDFTGEIETTVDGTLIISLEEITNPEFRLVTRWGNSIKTPLGRIGSRIARTAGWGLKQIAKIPERVRNIRDKFHNSKVVQWGKDKVKNNPISRWWRGDEEKQSGTGWFRNNFNNFISVGMGGGGNKTNDILINIYRLLNKRMAGVPEDESWIAASSKAAGGPGSILGAKKAAKDFVKKNRRRSEAKRRLRRMQGKKSLSDKLRDKYENLKGNEGLKQSLRARKDNIVGKFQAVTRKGRAVQQLRSRDDDVAEYLLTQVPRNARAAAKKQFTFMSKEKRNALAEKLGYVAKKENELNRKASVNIRLGKRKLKRKGKSTTKLLSELVRINEMSWFNQMRRDAEGGEVPPGRFRAMIGKFSKRVRFTKEGEHRDYFRWFRGKKYKKEEKKGKKKKGGLMPSWKPSSFLGKLTQTALSWISKTIMFTVGGLLKGGLKVGGFLLKNVVGTALRGVVAPVAKGLIGGAAAVGGAIVSAVGWPVIAAGAAIGAVAWGAYKLATRKRAYYLDKLRLAQYGIRDYDLWSSDDGAKTRYIEDQLKQFTTFDGEGRAVLRGLSDAEVTKLAVGYGVEKENTEEMLAFHAYMQQRFIPLYLWWLTGTRKAEGSPPLADLGSASKVSKKDMLAIFNYVKRSADDPLFRAVKDPRNLNRGMFKRAWDWVTFTNPEYLSGEEVAKVTAEVEKEIKNRRDVKRKFEAKEVAKETVAVSTVESTFKELREVDSDNIRNNDPSEENKVDGFTGAAQPDYFQPFVEKTELRKSDLTALEAVRYKAYGLTTLSEKHIKMLAAFEDAILPNINRTTGAYEGDLNQALTVLGVGTDEAKRNRARVWFIYRFLPVYATYVLACKRYAPAANPNRLVHSGSYIYEIALMLERVLVERSGVKMSVWAVREMPFDIEPNTDSSSIQGELRTLEKLSKEKDMTVRNLLKDAEIKNKPIFARKKDRSQGMFETTAPENYKSGTVSPLAESYKPATSTWGNFDTSNAKPIVNMEPKAGSYASVRDGGEDIPSIIRNAAEVAGISPLLLLTVAQMESSLNPNARPPKGNAAGLFQFMPDTWDEMVRKHGNRYGIPKGTPPTDPVASALLGAEYLKEGSKVAKSVVGKEPSAADFYMPHFLGPGDARKFYKGLKENPDGIAAKTLPGPAKYNPRIFYDNNGRARTFSEVYKAVHQKMASSESYVRKYVDSSHSDINVTGMFDDLSRETRRNKAIEFQAKRDSEKIGETIKKTSAPMPDGTKLEMPPLDVVKPINNSVETFAAKHPSITEEEKEAYSEHITENVARSNVVDLTQLIENANTNTNTVVNVLESQYKVQDDILKELRRLLKWVLEREGSREAQQEVRDLSAREVVQTQRRELVIEHGESRINTKRVRNL